MSLVEHDLSGSETKLYRSDNHYKDWIDAIKSRGSTVSDFEVGHRTASVCNIANIAYDIRRPLTWNPETERFVNDQYANSMLSREYRDGYSL